MSNLESATTETPIFNWSEIARHHRNYASEIRSFDPDRAHYFETLAQDAEARAMQSNKGSNV